MRPLSSKSLYQPARGEHLQLFATPIFRGFCPLNLKEIADDVRDIIAEVKQNNPDKPLNNTYTSYFHEDARDRTEMLPWFEDFANVMKDSYVDFIRLHYNFNVSELDRRDIHFCAWVNRYEGGNWHDTHNHVNSLISGTFYVKTVDTQPIKFWSPNNVGEFATRAQMDYYENIEGLDNIKVYGTPTMQHEVQVFPREGEFLLWPSYLLHGVPQPEEQDDKYERISISFNLTHNEPLSNTHHGTPMSYGFLK